MTPKGRKTLDDYVNAQAKRERQLLARLSAVDKQQLNDLLRKLLASLAEKPDSRRNELDETARRSRRFRIGTPASPGHREHRPSPVH